MRIRCLHIFLLFIYHFIELHDLIPIKLIYVINFLIRFKIIIHYYTSFLTLLSGKLIIKFIIRILYRLSIIFLREYILQNIFKTIYIYW